jgi:hypothetical protein
MTAAAPRAATANVAAAALAARLWLASADALLVSVMFVGRHVASSVVESAGRKGRG